MNRLERMRALCAADPKNVLASYSLAMEIKKTDPQASLEVFEGIRRAHPGYVASYYHYGQTLQKMGELERAASIYREGLAAARSAGDMHAHGELEQALDLIA